MNNEMINVMGLWENTDKNGNKYLTGNLGSVRVLIFRNTYKKGEREPDYNLSVSKREFKKNDEPQGEAPAF